jgi:hypothetical protein
VIGQLCDIDEVRIAHDGHDRDIGAQVGPGEIPPPGHTAAVCHTMQK